LKDYIFDDYMNLYVLFTQARDAFQTAREQELNKFGLSTIEMGILFHIYLIETYSTKIPTTTEIARWLFRKRNSISETVTRMERKGLVKRVPNPNSKKEIRIQITEEGQSRFERGFNEGKLVEKVFSSLSSEERSQMWVIMGKLRNSVINESKIKTKPPFPKFIG
jgi:MarR family transcriptional regulator, 2-MHQ and catechol-resistance regulon repressor